jgi:DNA-binding Lrp family transcriptional regulator
VLLRFAISLKATISLKRLSEITLLSKPTVIKVLKELQASGKLTKCQEKNNGIFENNSYLINEKYVIEDSKRDIQRSKESLLEVVNVKDNRQIANEKEEKLVKENKFAQDSDEYRLAEYLFKHIKRNNQKAKEPNLQKWAKSFDYILRIDKRDFEEVKTLIKWCQNDTFWYKNILSADSLRKQYDRLVLGMKNNNKPGINNRVKERPAHLMGWE